MNWFRSIIRSCAGLALFALAVQMAVSFGHMHPDDLGLPPLAAADRTPFTSATTRAPASPGDQDHHPAPDDYCPICASMALVATAIVALPPILTAPEPMHHVWLDETPQRSVSSKFALSFQARAPPAV